jgi:hypothetical protein
MRMLGLALGLAGLWVIFGQPWPGGDHGTLGTLAVVTGMCSQALGLVWIKRLNVRISSLAITTGALGVAVPCFMLAWVIADSAQLPPDITPRASAAIVYLGVLGSVVGFTLYYYLIKHLDAGRIALILGIGGGQVAGKLSGRAEIEAVGKTLDTATQASRGHAVLAMTQGRIARRLLEMASADLRSVFRRDERLVRISCLLGVVTLEGARATIQRLRLETPVTTLVGGGHVDLATRRLDVTVKSIASSTGFFALDIPIRLTGRLARPRIDPLLGESAQWLDGDAGSHATEALPPRLQELVTGNRCAR